MGQQFGIGGRRFGAKEPVFGGEIAEIFRNCLHRPESVVKAFEGTGERAIRHGQDFI